MKGIQERKSLNGETTYRAQVRLKGARPLSATFKRKTDALKWKQQVETEIRLGRHFPSQEARKYTVSDLIERFINETFSQRRSKGTPAQTLAWWSNAIGHVTLDKLSTALIKQHWDSLAGSPSERTGNPRSNRTLNCYLETFSAALSKGHREYGWIAQNPAALLKRRRLPRGRIRCLDTEEREAFLREVNRSQNPYLKPAVLISMATGARKTEVLSLRWSEVDLKDGRVTFLDTKNGDVRSVALRGEALDCLKQHAGNYRFLSNYVFPGRKPKRLEVGKENACPWEDPRSAFEAACSRAKISNFRWHDMRHCAASYLLASGASLAEVGKILGHKTPQMTWRYSHLVGSKADDLIQKMTETFLRQTSEN